MNKYLSLGKKDSEELSLQSIRHEVNTFIFGGHDTSAIASTFAILILGHHPEVQDKIFEELESIFQGGVKLIVI